jgi:hypothetical protein
MLMFYCCEPVFYLDPVSKFQFSESTIGTGYFVGYADDTGDALEFKILKNDFVTVYIEVW